MKSPIKNRIDFLLLFDVTDGNPNGDPDFDNAPRVDPETNQGLVSDVCLKRKIRDYVQTVAELEASDQPGLNIFVQQGHSLESQQKKAFTEVPDLKDKANSAKTKRDDITKARDWMCANFFDVRAFGAVMSTTKFNCGQVRGPVQITFARSADPIQPTEHAITRVAYTTQKKHDELSSSTEMGRKHTTPYGLYAAHGFINPAHARHTGFNDDDLALLWRALANMFDLDHSASRGRMATRHLFAFQHASALGEAPSHRLFDLVKVAKKTGVEFPRAFSDYTITPLDDLRQAVSAFEGVTVEDKAAG